MSPPRSHVLNAPPIRRGNALPAPAPRRADAPLVAAGLAAALASAAFAFYMVSNESTESRVAGVEHFGIFAKPRTAFASVRPGVPDSGRRNPRGIDEAGVDYTPTGAIPAAPRAAKTPPAPVRVFTGPDGLAWIATEARGFIRPRTGDFLPSFGRIASISFVGNRWVILSDSGARLEAASAGSSNDSSRPPDRAFARGMIFDPAKKN